MEAGPPVGPRQRALGSPDRCGDRPCCLGKSSGAKEVGDNGTERQPGSGCKKERELVDVLNQNVRSFQCDCTFDRRPPNEGKTVPAAYSLDIDSFDFCSPCGPGPARTNHSHAVASCRQPSEDLEQVDLGSAGMRIGQVLPVDDEDVHTEESKD
jgi:hypothetical protein